MTSTMSSKHPRRRFAMAGVATTFALALAACGVSGGSDGAGTGTTSKTGEGSTTTIAPAQDPDTALHDAANATLKARSFRIESEANLEIAAQTVHLRAVGPVDYDSVIANVQINVEQGSKAQEIEIRANGSTFWVRPKTATVSQLPEGKTWVQGKVSRLEKAASFKPTGLIGVLLALLGSTDAKRVGTGEIDGIKVVEYKTTISYAAAVRAAGDRAKAFQSALSLTSGKDPQLVTDVSVGADGVIRKMRLEIQVPSGLPLGGTYAVDLTKVGQPVDKPDAPPDGQILKGAKADKILDQILM
ncbi:MAG: hypothetical protein ACR2MB_08455 [Acidimicrobiales bacterium]